MKKTNTACMLGFVAITVLLAGCHHGKDISIDGRSVTLHAANAPVATITSRGSFSVGSKIVKISPDQRQLFIRYYNDVVTIHKQAEAMKKAGFAVAGKALHLAGHSIEHAVGLASGSSAADKAASESIQAKGNAMEKEGQQLCDKVKQIENLQATIAAQVAAFKPYAKLDPAPGVQCSTTTTVVVDN